MGAHNYAHHEAHAGTNERGSHGSADHHGPWYNQPDAHPRVGHLWPIGHHQQPLAGPDRRALSRADCRADDGAHCGTHGWSEFECSQLEPHFSAYFCRSQLVCSLHGADADADRRTHASRGYIRSDHGVAIVGAYQQHTDVAGTLDCT